ncbi:YLS9 protein [Spatholobus suberectus]|nr:YLS9 protein [Spatholobus suberectus]
MSTKECGHHEAERRHLLRLILGGLAAFVLLVLLLVFLVWVILRPTKPRFTLQDATLYAFNLSPPAPNTLSLTVQATLSAHNPNARVGVYYHGLRAYASYRSQQISLATALPDAYQGHRDFTVWSPFLFGNAVPVAPFVLASLQQDQSAGPVLVNVKVSGRVKWKVGSWVSGRYHIYVNCPAYIRFAGDRSNAAPAVKFQLLQSCSVDV